MKTREEQGIELLKSVMYENCVSCKKQTRVLKDTHIDYRLFYIEGVGQLCEKCYKQNT